MSSEPDATPRRDPGQPKLLGLRLSVMMFFQWAMFGIWVPVAGRFLRASVADGGLSYTGFWYTLAGIGLVATIIVAVLFRDETATDPEPGAAAS